MKRQPINRRAFFKTCLSTATVVAANPNLLAQADGVLKEYAPALLTTENNEPISSRSFEANQCFIFNYPFVTTPCFLIDLGHEVSRPQQLTTMDANNYQWPGGIGPNKSVVAFSAICAHKLSYPTRSTSFINYRPEEITYVGRDQQEFRQRKLIYCCSERSVYDPAKGAKVLGGPATQPLTAIILRHDPDTDHYYATATLGGELYNRFFDNFGYRIALENRNDNIRDLVAETTTVYSPESFTSYQVLC